MAYSPNIFKKPWYVQVPSGLSTLLSIPPDVWVPEAKTGDEWTQIQALYTPLGLSGSLQATINSVPFLRLFPTEVTRSNDGQAPEYQVAGSGTSYKPGQIRRRFSVTLSENRAGVLDALEDAANSSNFGDAAGQWPLIVLDFCYPELADKKAGLAAGYQPYSVRLGMISEVTGGPTLGFPGYDQFRHGQAGFQFQERGLRRVV